MSEPAAGAKHVAILGGGLAGIAAAVRLAQLKYRVTLVETRKRLGGRATSNIDPATGELLDNCQHVLLKCCTNLLDLYRRLHVDHLIEWHSTLHFLDRNKHHDVLRATVLPAPFHLSLSMLGFSSLSWRAKIAIGRAMLSILQLDAPGLERLSRITLADWLREQRQPPQAISQFWEVIIVSALNETADRANAAYAIQVFRDGFLPNRNAYVVGVPRVQLSQLYDTAQPLIESAGGSVLLGTSVRAIHFDGTRVGSIELSDGSPIVADAYISALPFDRLDKVISPDLRKADSRLAHLAEFEVSPILGIHLWFDRPVMSLPHSVLVDSPLQWIFNRGMDQGRQHIHVVISAARDWIDLDGSTIVQKTIDELMRYFPEMCPTNLTASKVIKEKRATFSAKPTIENVRPATSGTIANLFLAGDWSATGWPATMEGAVRSGYLAAEAISGTTMVVKPMIIDPLVKWIQNV